MSYVDRAANSSRNEGNSLATGKISFPDDVIVLEPYLISHAVNRKVKEKRPIDQPETVELFLKYIKECEFSGVDFEAMASGFHGFVGRHSPRDNPTHVKEGYLMTVLGGLPSFHSANQNRKRST